MSHPTDYYLLQIGFGGLSGPISNTNQEGFASAAFHPFPDTLKWDAYSEDYGPNFLGHALNTGAFLLNHPNFGWQTFGGLVTKADTTSIVFSVRDMMRRRVYIAPLGVLFTLDAGAFDSVEYVIASKSVVLGVVPAAAASGVQAPQARLLVSQPAVVAGVGTMVPSGTFTRDEGAYVVPFSSGEATVTVRPG